VLEKVYKMELLALDQKGKIKILMLEVLYQYLHLEKKSIIGKLDKF
jgi:hypothetical protein